MNLTAYSKLDVSEHPNDLEQNNEIESHELNTTYYDNKSYSNDNNDYKHVDLSSSSIPTPTVPEFELEVDSPILTKLYVILSQAIPVIISFFLGVGGGFINLMFAGTYVYNGSSSTVLAAISLANMFCNVTFLSLLIGLSSAIETLGSQHNGAKNYREVGLVLQRGIIVLGCLVIPMFIVWWNSYKIFSLIGIESDVCEVIKHYIRIRSLTMPADVFYISYDKYLMSIGVVQPSMWESIGFNALIIILNTVFVYHFKFGYQCLAWSWVIATYSRILIEVSLSLLYEEVKRTLQTPSWEALKGMGSFVKLGIPGTLMICSEWWAFEILTVFASVLGTENVAAQTIILQTASLCYMVPLGFSIASASLVGNALGAKKKELAISISDISLYCIMVGQFGIAVLLWFVGPYYMDSYTKNKTIRELALKSVPLLVVYTWFDGIQGVAQGILRGAGKQKLAAITNILAFYALGLPMAWFLTFRLHYGVYGLMLGLAIGMAFQVTFLVYTLKCCKDFVFTSIHDAEGLSNLDTNKKQSDSKGEKKLIAVSPMLNLFKVPLKRVRQNSSDTVFTIEEDDEDVEILL